nr:MAG TPA: hypothetical protein [Caudoviricetes sp.]
MAKIMKDLGICGLDVQTLIDNDYNINTNYFK